MRELSKDLILKCFCKVWEFLEVDYVGQSFENYWNLQTRANELSLDDLCKFQQFLREETGGDVHLSIEGRFEYETDVNAGTSLSTTLSATITPFTNIGIWNKRRRS